MSFMEPKLGVNIDHVATLRQQRGTPYPDMVSVAQSVVDAGADQITMHLREDRRHVQDLDVFQVRKKVKTTLNFEMAMSKEMVDIALKLKPDWVCLVPEKRQELTTEGGLNVVKYSRTLDKVIQQLHKKKIKVSLFIEPDIKTVQRSLDLGANAVEIHTGRYCMATQKAFGKKSKQIEKVEFKKIIEAGKESLKLKLGTHAGHGFDYENVRSVVEKAIFTEYNIGHAIVCRSVEVGIRQAVREMIAALRAP